jgi:hypothetical protein
VRLLRSCLPLLLVQLAACGPIEELFTSKKKSEKRSDTTADDERDSKRSRGDDSPRKGADQDVPEGTYVADNGFRPGKHGFKFANSGGEGKATVPIFTVRSAREMFGDEAVCQGGGVDSGGAATPEGKNAAPTRGQWVDLDEDGEPDLFLPEDEAPDADADAQPKPPLPTPPPFAPTADCSPTAAAQGWIQMVNDNANGGVCEGMAVASLMLKTGLLDATTLQPGATSAWDLEKTDPTRELIGKYFAYQFTDPTDSTTRELRKRMTPNDVLDELQRRLAAPSEEQVTLGFYQAGKGGHAVVPYAVEDKGGGKFWVRIYDNNAPGVSRYIEFDRNANTWVYGMGAINPSEAPDPWGGNAKTFSLDFTSLALRKARPACPFCRNSGGHRQIWSPDSGDLLVKDPVGNAVGYANGVFVNTLPGAYEIRPRGNLPGARGAAPVLVVPTGTAYSVTIDGNGNASKDDEIAIFGDGVVILIDDLELGADQNDTLTVQADGRGFKYQPGDQEAPDIRMILDGADTDFVFSVDDLEAGAGEALEISVDESTGRLRIFDSGGGGDRYDLDVVRIRGRDVDVFSHEDIALDAGDAEFVDFGHWEGEGKPLSILEDEDHDGDVDGNDTQTDEE